MDPSTQRSSRFSLDPVLVVGTLLSVGLGVFFFFSQSIAAALATFAGLLGIIITLQIQSMTKERQRAEHQTRIGAMISTMESSPGLLDVVESMLSSARKVEASYLGTPAMNAYRQTMEECRTRLTELEGGRFHVPYSDNELALSLCENLRREFLATSVPANDLAWWLEPEGGQYWRTQLQALAQGVQIRRVFIHTGWSDDVDQLAREQQRAGVEVRRIHRERLPVGARGIIGIWDERCGVEVVYDASGEAALFSYTVAPSDLDRLRRQFEFVERMAVGIDEAEPTSGVTGSASRR